MLLYRHVLSILDPRTQKINRSEAAVPFNTLDRAAITPAEWFMVGASWNYEAKFFCALM
jgi:hypothetical protein